MSLWYGPLNGKPVAPSLAHGQCLSDGNLSAGKRKKQTAFHAADKATLFNRGGRWGT
jgi:hypothetical protein